MSLAPGEPGKNYALGGVARGGNTRAGYVSSRVFILQDGAHIGDGRDDPAVGTILASLSITDVLDEAPNSCRYRVQGAVPDTGSDVIITLGSKNRLERLFAGHALTVQQIYAADNPQYVQADVSAVDYTWQLGFILITKRYVNLPASTIAKDLIATAAANGFTSGGVAADLPALDEITYTNEDLPSALTRLARRIGAYWYVDYHKVVHLFFTEPQRPDPEPLTVSHKSLAHFRHERDRTQVLTRVYVEGRGSTVLGAVAAGDTKIPLAAVDMFEVAADVFVKVSPQGSEGGSQHLMYSGVVPGGKGSLVGPGIGPSAAVTLTAQGGGAIQAGTHGYAVTFATAAGESLASPVASITVGSVANPTAPITDLKNLAYPWYSNFAIGDVIWLAHAFSTAATQAEAWASVTLAHSMTTTLTTVHGGGPTGQTAGVTAKIPYSTDPRVKWVCVYLWTQSRNQWGRAFAAVANNPGGDGTYVNFVDYPGPPYGLPASNTTTTAQVAVSAIPVGSSAVTGRKLYRTAANQAQLKLLATIADNTSTTYQDAASDATLGANIPMTDTSGLQQPPGQVLPGSTSIVVAGTTGFEATGGWASIGNGEQEIRYTGLTAGSLTGIPSSGIGSITAAIAYNSTITASPMLTGIPTTGARAITTALTRGDELYLVVQVDDVPRQGELAADVGGPGVREEWIQDRRLSLTEARRRGQATLAIRPLDQEKVTYTCRDLRTAAGTTIDVNLGPPTNVAGTYKIQQVTIGNFRASPAQYPTYTVDASSRRFSFEDWLRVLKTKE
jgi:hypothetical protein